MGNGKDKLGASYSRDRLGGYISHNMGNQRCDKKEKGKKKRENLGGWFDRLAGLPLDLLNVGIGWFPPKKDLQ